MCNSNYNKYFLNDLLDVLNPDTLNTGHLVIGPNVAENY